MVTVNWLDSFLALARTHNFSRAAESLYVTQPAFSRSIAELEQKVGCQLFKRNTRPVSFTAQGEIFYRWACVIERNISDMTDEIALACQGVNGSLRVGYYGEPQIVWLNKGLAAVKASFPRINWSVCRDHPARLEALLFQNELDAAFMHSPHVEALYWAEYRIISSGGMCVLLPSGHPMEHRDEVSIRDIVNEPYVSFPREVSPYAYDLEMRPFQDINVSPRICATAEDIEALGLMVAGGNGITILSQATAEMFRRSGLPVTPVKLIGYDTGFDLVLAWKKGAENPYLSVFRDSICH